MHQIVIRVYDCNQLDHNLFLEGVLKANSNYTASVSRELLQISYINLRCHLIWKLVKTML